jgi:hypothetical protein
MPRRDYRMSRDGKNTYGSESGYVVSRRSRRDRAMRGDRAMDYARGGNRGGRGRDYEMDYRMTRDYYTGDAQDPYYFERKMISDDYGNEYNVDYDKASRRDYARNINYSGSYGGTPFQYRKMENYGRDYNRERDYGHYGSGMDYGYDYATGSLNEEELEDWSHELLEHVDSKDRDMLKKEKVIKKAEDMGIKFDQFSPDEFYITTLMMYTDYCKVLGNASLDIYLRLAKAWLMDEDVQVKAGEKLAVYYDEIVGAE